ncbi:hypothetical protein EOD42_22350 [Rhodovarius crocodyli]|uniref:Uncharacterized protein n=1 Tax=Rhodovarius crocodyli TaxID=1979269 RepID=A0A437M104_9PROT|nr:DUF6525 family protein [Rhodovarius crocodyli]RVT91399.1 hypothetical protein EOD42_22350 [Rhodovarius crocodyli]
MSASANDQPPAGASTTDSTHAEEMAAFDALPGRVRWKLDNALRPWSAVNLLARWQRCASVYGRQRATERAVAEIERADLQEIEARRRHGRD